MNSKIKAIAGAMLACLIGTASAVPTVAAPPPWVVTHHHYHRYYPGYYRGYHRHFVPGYSYAPGYYRYGYYGQNREVGTKLSRSERRARNERSNRGLSKA